MYGRASLDLLKRQFLLAAQSPKVAKSLMWLSKTGKLAIPVASSSVAPENEASGRMAGENSIDQELEIELLRRVGEGDRKSFEDLYDRFCGVLFSAALQILNDQREAEDVLQEVFIQIWDRAKLYNAVRGKPLTWAMTLTRNKAIDRLRAAQRRYRLQDRVEKETKVTNQVVLKDSAEDVDALEKSRIIRAAVLQLSNDQREAIELAFFSGLTQNEIAHALNQPLGTVKARIRRGMLKLKEMIPSRL